MLLINDMILILELLQDTVWTQTEPWQPMLQKLKPSANFQVSVYMFDESKQPCTLE